MSCITESCILELAQTQLLCFFSLQITSSDEMWVGAMLWLGWSRQIRVINVIKMQRQGKPVTVAAQSHLFNAYPVGKVPSLLAWSMSGFLSGFYRRVDRLLAKVEMVQWAEGTRWHGSMRRGGNHILLQSGNKAGQQPCVCHLNGSSARL